MSLLRSSEIYYELCSINITRLRRFLVREFDIDIVWVILSDCCDEGKEPDASFIAEQGNSRIYLILNSVYDRDLTQDMPNITGESLHEFWLFTKRDDERSLGCGLFAHRVISGARGFVAASIGLKHSEGLPGS